MMDGTQRELRHVKIGDEVASWDDEAEQVVGATVVGTERVTARWLIELSIQLEVFESGAGLNSSPVGRLSQCTGECQHASLLSNGGSLFMTLDHPIFSTRLQGLVSMDPLQTRIKYGLSVEQMRHQEILHHYQGHTVGAAARHILGTGFVLMTIQLARYHWFFAHGVRVHNKARGTGMHTRKADGGSDKEEKPPRIVKYTDSDFSTNRLFAEFILRHSGSRRRYGTYENQSDSSCTLQVEEDVDLACDGTIVANTSNSKPCCLLCYDCLNCTEEKCMRSIPSCDDFLSQAYAVCELVEYDDRNIDEDFMLLVWIASGVLIGCPSLCCSIKYARRWQKQKRITGEIVSMSEYRSSLVASNDCALSKLELNGECFEKDCSFLVSYAWSLNERGEFMGSGQREDGISRIEGKLKWDSFQQTGEVVWAEHWMSRDDTEFQGSINLSGEGISVFATYIYPYQRGNIVLQQFDVIYSTEFAKSSAGSKVGLDVSQDQKKQIDVWAEKSNSTDDETHADLGKNESDACISKAANHESHLESFVVQAVDEKIGATLEEETQANTELETTQASTTIATTATAAAASSMIPEDEGTVIDIPLTPDVTGAMLNTEMRMDDRSFCL